VVSSTFNSIDLLILVLLGISILIGVLRGATREILGIAGWVGAFAIVIYGLPLFRPLGRHYIQNPMLADAVVAGIIFILSLGVFILISRLISASVKGSMFGSLDRSLGLVFGFVRGVLVICLVFLAMGFFYPPDKTPESVQRARFTPWITEGAQELKRLIPKDYLPHDLKHPTTIHPLDAEDFIKNSLPNLEETVKNLSTLKPTSPKKPEEQKDSLDKLIEQHEPETQK
jgi:membrane protein required for colicin V production